MNEITKQSLENPKTFGKAMELLKQYRQLEHSFEDVSIFMAELEDDDDDLLNLAIDLDIDGKKKDQTLHKRIAKLENQQQSLINALQHQTVITPTKTIDTSTANDLTIVELADKFKTHKKNIVASTTFDSIRSKIDMFIKITTEANNNKSPRITELDDDKIRNYRDTLQKIPAHRLTFPPDSTINDWINSDRKPLSQKTICDSTNLIGEFLTWIDNERYPIDIRVKTIFKSVKKPTKNQKEDRNPFSDHELKSLFESHTNYIRESDYWVPLLALFTGARLHELLQLHIADIKKNNKGIWYFDINDHDEKHTKTKQSIRKVPIHPTLVDLGFIDFVKHEKHTSNTRLFYKELPGVDNRFSAFSKRFRHYKEKKGVLKPDGKRLDFHSFRHTVRTRLTEIGADEVIIDSIIGHSSKGSMGFTQYAKTADLLPNQLKTLEKLQYEIDFGKMSRWYDCKFN